MAECIVKVQRPLASSSRMDIWLVYDQYRTRKWAVPMHKLPAWVTARVVDKAYFAAIPDPDTKTYEFIQEVEDQPW